MVDIEELFYNREHSAEALLDFGFQKTAEGYFYVEKIVDGSMQIEVTVSSDKVKARVLDLFSCEPYTLFLSEDAVGSFVGEVRCEFDRILMAISDNCFEKATVFRSPGAKAIIAYVARKYGDELEFLWARTPDCAIYRRPDNAKWYAVLMTVSRQRLGIIGSGNAEIIDLRMDKNEAQTLLDGVIYLPGYHMNKKGWLTLLLDGSVSEDILFERLDKSYKLALKK